METLLLPFSPRYIVLTICGVVTVLLLGIALADHKVFDLVLIPTVIFAALTALIAGLGFATLHVDSAQAGDPCVHKKLDTKMVADACKKGGQEEAKTVMKAWNKEKGIKSCNQCHTKLAPSYELKDDGLDQYKKLGGK